MSVAKRREAEGQIIDRLKVTIPGQGTFYIHQENMCKQSLLLKYPTNTTNRKAGGVTKYPNHSETPNAEFESFGIDPEKVSGEYRLMLRVKPGCRIKPGDPVTVDYGDLYFIGFGGEIYKGPGLLPR
jgi:hypothetical protein